MSPAHTGAVRPAPTAVTLATKELHLLGLTMSVVHDGAVDYLLLQSRADRSVMRLLPVGEHQPLSGLAGVTGLGRLHALPWALVWGRGTPPGTMVTFSTDELRFRREVPSPTVELGPIWLAAAGGVFTCATVDLGHPAEQWLALAQSW